MISKNTFLRVARSLSAALVKRFCMLKLLYSPKFIIYKYGFMSSFV